MYNLVGIFIGGGLGSLARYGISEFVKLNFKSNFPLATLVSNVISCLILALTVLVLGNKITEQPLWRLIIIVGFCGGFSTFSSFSFETVQLIKSGEFSYAIANVTLSAFVCISIIYLLLKNHNL